jgi:hypothetical protein
MFEVSVGLGIRSAGPARRRDRWHSHDHHRHGLRQSIKVAAQKNVNLRMHRYGAFTISPLQSSKRGERCSPRTAKRETHLMRANSLSDEEKKAAIRATHDAAWAMVEDLRHMRGLLGKRDPAPEDIRRIAVLLRRLLIDGGGGDLRKIAPPRMGKVMLSAPDNLPLVKQGKVTPWQFLSAGVADVLGHNMHFLLAERGHAHKKVPEHDETKLVPLKLDGFLSQQVLCFEGEWVNRRDVIKYIAHVGHGVHSLDVDGRSEEILKQIRHALHYTFDDDGKINIKFNSVILGIGGRPDQPLWVDRNAMDVVLVQLMSAARYLTISPDIVRLEEVIRAEKAY